MNPLIWNLDPEVFNIVVPFLGWHFGPRYYGLLFATGFLVSYQMMQSIYIREGKPIESLSSLLFYMMIGTIVGARVGHCLFYEPEYYLANPLRILEIWKGGLASHGGTIGVLVAIWMFSRKYLDQSIPWLMDRLASAVAFTCGCIRLGNFFNSEIIGKPTDLPWAIVFKRIDDIPRHPAMLYESASYFILSIVAYVLYRKKGKDLRSGFLTGLFFVWVFGSRFILEFVKENQVDFESGMVLKMGQLLSIPFIALGIIFMMGWHERLMPFLLGPAEKATNAPNTAAAAHKKKKRKRSS